ncbi:MAG: hypothetical protein Q7U07_01670 [Gammaproteobacteria bacterium]|nr:hypothetical protein [Gammaproteobacteria bacterium]
MTKLGLLLIALAAGEKSEYTPVQIQKLIFLVEQNVGNLIGGPFFEFRPYNYGPFDSSIYELLRQLEADGLVSASVTNRGWKMHSLTDAGLMQAVALSAGIDKFVMDYIKEASKFVRTLSFADLVSAIYKAYPEMKANSVFTGS